MGLAATITAVLADHPPHADVRRLVGVCHDMSVVYLRRKAAAGGLNPALFGVSLEDLALDCIADLFRRDDRGGFPEFRTYFTPLGPAAMEEDRLLGALRRLVFGKITESLYVQYRDLDPSLHRVIRNLKSAALRVVGTDVDSIGEGWWVVFDERDLPPRPVMPREVLDLHVADLMRQDPNLRALLRGLGVMLREQQIYRPALPLMALAHAVRAVFTRPALPEAAHDPLPGDRLEGEEIHRWIADSVSAASGHLRPGYVDRGKMPGADFDLLFCSVRSILAAELTGTDGEGLSYFEHFRLHCGGVDPDTYRRRHRSHLEYFVRLTRRDLGERVRRELGSFRTAGGT